MLLLTPLRHHLVSHQSQAEISVTKKTFICHTSTVYTSSKGKHFSIDPYYILVLYIGKQYKYEIVVLRLISFCFFFNNSLHFHFLQYSTVQYK